MHGTRILIARTAYACSGLPEDMHLIWLVLSLWCFAQSCIDAFSAEGSSEKPMMVVVELQRQQCQHRPDLTATFSESLAWPVNFDARLQLLPPACLSCYMSVGHCMKTTWCWTNILFRSGFKTGHLCLISSHCIISTKFFFFFFFFFWVTGELSTLRQLMKVPNEPGLSPNNGLENVSLSDQSMASNPRKVAFLASSVNLHSLANSKS